MCVARSASIILRLQTSDLAGHSYRNSKRSIVPLMEVCIQSRPIKVAPMPVPCNTADGILVSPGHSCAVRGYLYNIQIGICSRTYYSVIGRWIYCIPLTYNMAPVRCIAEAEIHYSIVINACQFDRT